jgi:hypothetical protein
MENNDYNLNDEPNLPLNHNDKDSFGLPSDYFASFEDKLRKKMEMQDELEQYPALSSIQKDNVFEVPADYFKKSENLLEAKSELAAYLRLQSIKTFDAAELTADYINYLNTSVNYKIELVEELKEYQTLYTIDKVNAFIVSDSYFETATERIKERIHAVKETKTSLIHSLFDFIFGKKMAFAFGLVTIISLSLYLYQSSEKPLEIGDCKTLACLERQEILNNNKVISNFDEDQLMDLVDVNKLNQQLSSEKNKSITSTTNLNVDSINEDDLLDEL